MSEPFIASVILFAGNFAPRGWAFCAGQILPIQQNTALFSLLGTTYGGNGQTTFALPDLRGRVPIAPGQGLGLPPYALGEQSGTPTHTMTIPEMPSHNHAATFTGNGSSLHADVTVNVTADKATKDLPAAGDQLADVEPNLTKIYAASGGMTQVKLGGTSAAISGNVTGPVQVGFTGNSQPFSIMQPYLALNYIIAIDGFFPSRN
ncbi:microcystin-dependent protein [Neorhizobium huautlense]|uniref:Microcystin-dependent protein n=1 Tax=Neorhizobium huautlense TaxID=67774 RepID=A0ABT9PLB8_9HYPH|nr:tail fiber protein [Neorhizobium huautlense]MDP9835268.1 microcystin-dependent protein [Neorhizobium huautlense]